LVVLGIDPNVKEHSQYLNKISEDLVTNMQQMIDTAIKNVSTKMSNTICWTIFYIPH
jgi:hypothetical protein